MGGGCVWRILFQRVGWVKSLSRRKRWGWTADLGCLLLLAWSLDVHSAAAPATLTLFDAPVAAKTLSANAVAVQPVATDVLKRSRTARVQAAAISVIATNLSARTVLNLFDGLNVEVEWLSQ